MEHGPLLPPLAALALLLGWLALLGLTRLPSLRRLCLTGDVAGAGLLAALAALFHWRTLFTREASVPAGGGDFNSFYYPLARFAADQIQAGRLPLWNPTLHAGMPFAADFQVGLLYPLNMAAFLLARPFEYGALEMLAVIHSFLASLTMFCLWRGLGGGRPAAVAAGVVYAYGGFFVAHLGHPPMLAVAAWLPLLLLCLHQAIAGRSTRAIAGGAVVLALMLLAGHPQALLISLCAAAAWSLFLIWRAQPLAALPRSPADARDSPLVRHWARCLLAGGGLGLLGAALAAPVLLPALQLGRASVRASLSYAQSTDFSLRPLHLVHLLIPKALGDSPTSYLNALAFNGEVWAYAGVVTLLLAAAALLLRGRPAALFGLALAAAALLLMLGPATPLQGWLYRFAPGFGQVRAPGRWSLLYSLGLALAAAGGIDALRPPLAPAAAALLRAGLRAIAAAIAAGGLLLLLLTGQLLQPQAPSAPMANFLDGLGWLLLLLALTGGAVLTLRRATLGPRAAGGLLVGLVVLDLFSAHIAFNPTTDDLTAGFRHPEVVAALRAAPAPVRLDSNTGAPELWQPSTAALYDLQDVGGAYNPLGLAAYAGLYDLARRDRSSTLYDLLGVTHIVGRPDKISPTDALTPILTAPDKLVLYERHGGLPRAYVVHQARSFADAEEALAALRAPDFDPRREVVLVDGPPLPADAAAPPANLAEFIRDDPDRLELTAEAAAPAYLVIADPYYSGWRAEVDGQPAPILRANYAFRAVPLPPGRHTVLLIFDPPTWRIGWSIALVSTLAILLLLLLPGRLRRNQPTRLLQRSLPHEPTYY